MAEPCKHEKRGELQVDGADQSAWNSNSNYLGSVRLEFCDTCGVVLVAKRHVGLLPFPK